VVGEILLKGMLAFKGVTFSARRLAKLTRTVVDDENPEFVAVIVVTPPPTAVISPALDTVATDEMLVTYAVPSKDEVRFVLEPPASCPVTVS